MLVSPTKLINYRILRNRTFNFETPDKNQQNMVIIPSTTVEERDSIIDSSLFRPMQLLCLYTPRRFKPKGKNAVIIDQKTYYSEAKASTNGRIKKGKTFITAYGGQNLVFDIMPEYNKNKEIFSEFKKGIAFQKFMSDFFEELIDETSGDVDYTDKYIIFPLKTYIPDLKKKVTVDMQVVHPMILFLKSLYKKTINKAAYSRIKFIFFYNPNANALIKIDLKDPDLEGNFDKTLQYIYRLNNFNNGTDSLSDSDIDTGNIETLDVEDRIENRKEDIKNIILSKVAKTLRANSLTNFEAATRDEKGVIMVIDKKIESYLNNADNDGISFSDLISTIETDNEVKAAAIRYVESKKIGQQKLETISKNLEKENQIIGSIQDLSGDDTVNEPDIFKIQQPDMDSRIERSRLSSFDEEYNKKQAQKDLTAVISAFSNSDYLPITVDDVQIVDSSDDFNEKQTLSVRYKTDEGKPLSFQIDIPNIVDKRYFYLSGNKKSITKQLMRLPIVKTKPNRVEITSNFNKITIERSSGNLSRKNEYLLKILKSFKNNDHIRIEYGDNTLTNSKSEYVNDFEYEEFAGSVSSIVTPTYELYFNREVMDDSIATLDINEEFFNKNRTPIGFKRKLDNYITVVYLENTKVFEYDIAKREINDISDSMFEFRSL